MSMHGGLNVPILTPFTSISIDGGVPMIGATLICSLFAITRSTAKKGTLRLEVSDARSKKRKLNTPPHKIRVIIDREAQYMLNKQNYV